MSTLHDLDKYVRSLRSAAPRESNIAKKGAVLKKAPVPAAASAFSARPRAVAFTRPLDYEVPGTVAELRQPSRMSCWATTYTVLVSWRDQASMPIETALGAIGQKWVDLFKADTGSSAEQEAELFAAAGLVAEPLASHTLESWEGLLRHYGPLAVIIDVDPTDKRAIHMVLMTGIHGEGTAEGTTATIVDPARGDKRAVRFSDFLGQYQQGATRRTASGRHNQIIHWPKDVAFAGAKSFTSSAMNTKQPAPPAKTPPPQPARPEPWSTFFHFRKGSAFVVDGPLSYNGKGEVIERTADFLKFTMVMPAASVLGNDIPAADMLIEATYKREGKGNHVKATINGQVMEDPDAEIISRGTQRTIRPKFSGFTGPLPEWITVTPDGKDEIDLDMKIDGRDVDFDLELTSGSTGLALGMDPWSRFFPFAGGTSFLVNGPLSYDGRGRVIDRSELFLKFEMNMPAAKIVGKMVPALDLVVEATYVKEGLGNTVILTVNGVQHTDTNASITTDTEHNRRAIIPSIKIPGTNLEVISFAPDDRDEIDLDVTIDGQEHDFDLVKLKGPAGLSLVRGFAATSTAASALADIAAFAARTTASRWKLARAPLARRLEEIVRNPDVVNQGALNLCGPAIFFHVWARRDPLSFAKYAADMYEKGTAKAGTLTVKPHDDLVLNDYAKIVPRMGGNVTPIAEWMCLSAIRDSENAAIHFEGDPSENVAGITTPGELADWLKASGMYTRVTDEGNWIATKGVTHAFNLRPAANRDILCLINARILPNQGGAKKKLVDSFPNHYIQLLSRIQTNRSGTYEFDYWCWGDPPGHANVRAQDFIDNYYGAVTGEI